jgi:hypothetical protein
MQVEQGIPASVLVRVHLLGPLEISERDPSGTWKLVAKEQWRNSKPARSVFKGDCRSGKQKKKKKN